MLSLSRSVGNIEGRMKMEFCKLIKSEINDNGWRTTDYEREDGSIFHISVPSIYETETGERTYNELTQAEMIVSLYYKRSDVGKEEIMRDILHDWILAFNGKVSMKVDDENKAWFLDLIDRTREAVKEEEEYDCPIHGKLGGTDECPRC